MPILSTLLLTAALPVLAPRARCADGAAVDVALLSTRQEPEVRGDEGDTGGADDAERFAPLIAALDATGGEEASIQRLAALGVDLPRLVLLWHRDPSRTPFDDDRWSRVERAVERVSRRPLLAAIESDLAGDDPPAVARAALRLLRRIGSSHQAALLVELLGELDVERPGRGADSELALSTFAAIQRRDKELAVELGADVRTFSTTWVGLVAHTLAKVARSDEDLELVWSCLSARVAEDAMLSALVEVAPRYVYRVDTRHLEPLRRRMLSADTSIAEMAMVALARLGDDSITEQLIAFLTQSDARVRRAAAHSLRTLTGLPFGQDVERWEHWHEMSLEWWSEHGASLADDLRWSDGDEATRLIIEIAQQRTHRAELVDALVETFERSDEEVVDLAILCLRELRWRGTPRRLIDVLETHKSAQVQGFAWRALRTLTGMDAGPDAEAWRQALLL